MSKKIYEIETDLIETLQTALSTIVNNIHSTTLTPETYLTTNEQNDFPLVLVRYISNVPLYDNQALGYPGAITFEISFIDDLTSIQDNKEDLIDLMETVYNTIQGAKIDNIELNQPFALKEQSLYSNNATLIIYQQRFEMAYVK